MSEPQASADGFQLTVNALQRPPFDGLFCYNDELAVGALHALREAGRSVPEAVKVIGFDNLPITEYLPCPLTTVAQPIDHVVEAVVSLCAQRIDDFEAPARQLSFPTNLVMRKTASAAAQDLRLKVFETPANQVLIG